MTGKRLLRLLPALCLAVCLMTVCALAATKTLTLGRNNNVSMSENGTPYTFTPSESGLYRFRSEDGWYEYYGEDEVRGKDPSAQLYLGNTLIAEADDGVDANFRFCVELTAGTAYTLVLYSNFGGTISLPVCIERPTPVTATSWNELRDALGAGGDVTLDANVAAEASSEWLEVPKYTVSRLDLNGCRIDGSALPGQTGNDNDPNNVNNTETLHVEGTLTLLDSVGSGSVTAPRASTTRTVNGAVTVSDAASFTMFGGTVSSSGTNCCLSTEGRFDMRGGAISAENAADGAVEVRGNGVFTLTVGTVSVSGAASEHGAVYVGSSFDMQGGTVSAVSGPDCGVYVDYDAEAAISGGTVSARGVRTGGVHICGELRLSGAPSIDSVYLDSVHHITVAGPLTWSKPLPIIPESEPSKFHSWRITSGLPGKGTAAFFTTMDPRFAVLLNKDGEAVVSLAPVSYVDENGETRTTTEYVPISAESNFYWNGQFDYTGDGWLVVPPGQFSLNKVHLGYNRNKIDLILCDGASLEIASQLECSGVITVYGQAEGTGSLRVGSETSPSTELYAIRQSLTQSVPEDPTDITPDLTVCGGVVAAYGGTNAAIYSFMGCAVSGGTLIAHGKACGMETYLDENRYVTVTVSGGAVSFSSVRANLRVTDSFIVDGGSDVKPATDWMWEWSDGSAFNGSAYAGATLRVVDASFSGIWADDDTLVASVSVPWSAPRLIAAAYDGTGRLRGACTVVVSEPGRVRTGLPKNDDWTYKLMLVDQNYAPLLPAWEKTLADKNVK
ncbi:MAG: hypothetical protein IJU66_04245 [Oscillospiraceae bacterium]|nr:hypothetical protein [Oscillospiraceae bacterium]